MYLNEKKRIEDEKTAEKKAAAKEAREKKKQEPAAEKKKNGAIAVAGGGGAAAPAPISLPLLQSQKSWPRKSADQLHLLQLKLLFKLTPQAAQPDAANINPLGNALRNDELQTMLRIASNYMQPDAFEQFKADINQQFGVSL
jgi:hypothetical protein